MEIQVASRRHVCSVALDNIDSIAADLVQAKAVPGHALCLCTAPARKLVIRTVGKRHFLAVWPHDGHLHHYACHFYRPEGAGSTPGSPSEPAIRETAEGFDIATDFPLERMKSAVSGIPKERNSPPTPPESSRPSRARIGLLGILHHVWREGQLNQWGSGWKRNWWRVTQALLPVIEQGSFGRRPMSEWLYLVPEFREARKDLIEAAWQEFRLRLDPHDDAGEVRLGLVLGEAKLFEKSAFGYKLGLRHFPSPLYLSHALREKLTVSYPRAFHHIGSENAMRVICLCLVEVTPKGYLNAIDVALMATSQHYIPVDSSYEAVLADRLVFEQRSFSKPLKVEDGASTLPDFVLKDTDPTYVLEVFGMTSSDYLEKKAAKLEIYRIEGKLVWSWNADSEPHLPRLPDRAGANHK